MSYTPKRCSFCGKSIPLGTGVMFIRNDAVTFWYCSSKCRKNATFLKRDSRKLKWARQQGVKTGTVSGRKIAQTVGAPSGKAA
ncbi:MAG: 50S ribosomal protein L24e [Nitrososphaerales archaeon]